MKKVHVRQEKLLEILKANKEQYVKDYDQVVIEFREAGIAALEELLEGFRAGETDSLYIPLPTPKSHVQEYNDAIRIIDVSCDEIVELDEHEAQNLIMNNWSWAGQLSHTRAMYTQYLKK